MTLTQQSALQLANTLTWEWVENYNGCNLLSRNNFFSVTEYWHEIHDIPRIELRNSLTVSKNHFYWLVLYHNNTANIFEKNELLILAFVGTVHYSKFILMW